MAYDPKSLIGTRDPILEDYLLVYDYAKERFIARDVVNVAPVPSTGDGASEPPRIFKLTTLNDAPYRIPNADTGPKGAVVMVDIDHSKDTFEVSDKYVQASIELIEAGQATFDLEMAKTKYLAELLSLIHEKDIAAVLFDDANYATGFFDDLTSDPEQFTNSGSHPLDTMKSAIRTCIKWPTDIVYGIEAWDAFTTNTQVLSAFGFTGGAAPAGARVTPEMVAAYFLVDRVHVGTVRYDASAPGQDEDLQFIWGPHVAILHQASTPTVEDLAHTLCFSQKMSSVRKWDANDPGPEGSRFVRAGWNRAIIVKSNRCGFLLENVA